ncbi:MAG: YicC/YloC family endoribonuclease [Sutterellaceae bacterium]|nr:YicC family protein [Burkholderiaceae bacterium]MDW8430459.1 YicC/YloC family endoribonuclease [Sutterellaceae bacterium]
MPAISSMTGFGAAARPTSIGPLTVELRTVNARFLDIGLRLADDLRALEPVVRERIATALTRGKIDCRVWLQRDPLAAASELDETALARVARLAARVRQLYPEATPLSVGDILAFDGVLVAPAADPQQLHTAVIAALDEALEAVRDARAREGGALATALRNHCDAIESIVAQLRGRVPDLMAAMERKLAERLEKALLPALTGGTLTREEITDRIRQEVTLYGLRADIEEELQRLTTHVGEVRRALDAGGPVGRRLDFLMQELQREANTLGAKAAAVEMTQAAVELKLIIEQMREQVQNLE